MEEIKFHINGIEHTVGSEVSSDVTLLDYLRDAAELRGTKYMCREGGCGACIVSTVKSSGSDPVAVNSCLVSVTSCQDWEITTVEKIGNRLVGYHPLQTTLAKYNGSQCGYCSPGWIMAMYSLQQSKKLTMLEIEKSFGSNICRCTGYRPILEAFKQFATDAPHANKILDIEDLNVCKKNGVKCLKNKDCEKDDWCFVSEDGIVQSEIFKINLKDGKKLFRVMKLTDIFQVLDTEGDDSYMLVAGNTAKGAYPIEDYPRILIDISSVADLKGVVIDQNLIIGAGITLTETLDIFEQNAGKENFAYLQKLYDHLSLVAHIAVRNLGTIAGNLMIKHQHNDFPSDMFLLLETVGAVLTLRMYFLYRLCESMKEAMYLHSLLTEIGLTKFSRVLLHVDNQGAISLASDPVFHSRSKHIDIKYHFIRRVLKENRDIQIEYLRTELMLADILTKPLPKDKHFKCLKGLGVSCVFGDILIKGAY